MEFEKSRPSNTVARISVLEAQCFYLSPWWQYKSKVVSTPLDGTLAVVHVTDMAHLFSLEVFVLRDLLLI